MKVSIITIGDEILIGQVIDSNSAKIGQMVQDLGIRINHKWAISDNRVEMLYTFDQANQKSDIIFVTGGLGPTEDDITKEILAEFFQTKLVFSDQSFEHIKALFLPRNIKITDRHHRQCMIPENARLLDNQMGTALGLHIESDGKHWFAMPGVPYEMEYIMKHEVIPYLQSIEITKESYHRTIHIMGVSETQIADRIAPIIGKRNNLIQIAYLPSLGNVRLRLTVDENLTEEIKRELEDYIFQIGQVYGTAVIGYDYTSLEYELGTILKSKGMMIGTAESCTGGYVSHLLTSIPGSSAYFKGAIIAYTNEMKMQFCNVALETLMKFTAVSEETVIEMVKGSCEKLNLDIALAVSGIAGPDGGTAEAPVGTIWIAAGNTSIVKTRKLQLSKDRKRNIEAAAYYSLILAWEWISEHSS